MGRKEKRGRIVNSWGEYFLAIGCGATDNKRAAKVFVYRKLPEHLRKMIERGVLSFQVIKPRRK